MAAINRMSMAQQLNEQVDGQSILDGILEEVATASSAFTGVGADVAKASLAQSKEDTAKSRTEGLVARKGSSDIVKAAFTDPNASDVRDLFAVMKANEKNNEAEINADREARIIKASAEAPVDTNNSDNYNIGKAAIDARKNRVVSEQDQTFLAGEGLKEDDSGNAAAIDSAVREAVDNDLMLQSPDSITTDEERAEDAQSGSGVSTAEGRFGDTGNGLMSNLRPRARPEGLGEQKRPNTFNFSNTNNPATTMSDVYQDIGLAPGQVNPNAEKNLNKMLDNQFTAFMSNLDFDVTINDTIVKPGSTRIPDPKKKIKGTPNSRHFHGDALDISIKGLSTEQLDKLIISAQESGFKGFGFGNNILHMDLNGGKEAVRTWSYGNKYWGNNKAYPVKDMMARVRKGLK